MAAPTEGSDPRTIPQRWAEDGYVVVRQFFAGDELAAIAAQVHHDCAAAISRWDPRRAVVGGRGDNSGMLMPEEQLMFEPLGGADGPPQLRAMFGLHERSQYYAALLRHPRLLALTASLFDGQSAVGEAVQFIAKPPRTKYEFPLHQDNAYGQFWEPAQEVATGVLALDRQRADDGAIVVWKGSNHLPVLPHTPSTTLGASLAMVEQPGVARFPEVVLELDPGDLSFHAPNTIHRTGARRDGSDGSRRNLGLIFRSARATKDDQAIAAAAARIAAEGEVGAPAPMGVEQRQCKM